MNVKYKLNKENKVEEIIEGEIDTTYDSLEDFLDEIGSPVSMFVEAILEDVDVLFHKSDSSLKTIKEEVSKKILGHFEDLLSKEVSDRELNKAIKSLTNQMKKSGEDLADNTKEFITKAISNILKSNYKLGGIMFKKFKEAKIFTAHLDVLANEIENLEGVNEEMKKHLAFRIDRLSDLIEIEADRNEKFAALEKEAYGVNSGSLAYDADEAKYMSTFGGTGALKSDADEARYMQNFSRDNHQQVMKRQEPVEIKGNGPKNPQPSDNYNEQEVANHLKGIVAPVTPEAEPVVTAKKK